MEKRTESETIYSTPKEWLKLKLAPCKRFYYTERRGIDSVAGVLLSSCGNYIGLINETKPPFSEREGVMMSMKTSAIGGSLFDMVENSQVYLDMPENVKRKLAKETMLKEVKEETGYTPLSIFSANKIFNNSMSNEFVYGFIIEVDKEETPVPNPQTPGEALITVKWFEIGTDITNEVQCGKALAILASHMISYDPVMGKV